VKNGPNIVELSESADRRSLFAATVDYVAFKYENGANMAACLAERHITGCATEELKTGKFKPEWAGYGKPDVMKSAA